MSEPPQTYSILLDICAKTNDDAPVHLVMSKGAKAKNGYRYKPSYDGYFHTCNLKTQEISIAKKPKSKSVLTVYETYPLSAIETITTPSTEPPNSDSLLSDQTP